MEEDEKLTSNGLKDIPSYEDLRKTPSNLREQQRIGKLDKITCWVIFWTVALFIILIVDILAAFEIITYERILIILILINLPFLPYITEYGLGGFRIKKNAKGTRPE